jgi:serralysin
MPREIEQLRYEDDWSAGRLYHDDLVYYDASVDGQGGHIRDKPVFTIEEAAYYLNRGIGVQEYEGNFYNSGANWDGAQGTANNDWYWVSASKTNGGQAASAGQPEGTGATGPLTTLNYGFYETLATLPDPYVFSNASDGTNGLYIGFGVAAGFSAFDANQRDAARQAIESWDDLITVSFVETHFKDGDINFMNTTTGPIQASAYLPYDYGLTGFDLDNNPDTPPTTLMQDDGSLVSYYEIAGDVYVNPNQASNHLFDEGQ